MPWPEGDAIQFLADQGIKVLVNLTTEPASYQQVAESLGIRCVTEDIPDFCPPSMEQIQKIMDLIDKSEGPVGVHCAMGCGRTGTILACYLVASEGYTADDAIAEARKRRKGSIETRRQEQAVKDYEESLKKEKE